MHFVVVMLIVNAALAWNVGGETCKCKMKDEAQLFVK